MSLTSFFRTGNTANPQPSVEAVPFGEAAPISEAARAIIVYRALQAQRSRLRRKPAYWFAPKAIHDALTVARACMYASITAPDADERYSKFEAEAKDWQRVIDNSEDNPISSAGSATETGVIPAEKKLSLAFQQLGGLEELLADRQMYLETPPDQPVAYSQVVRDALLLQARHGQPGARIEALDLLAAPQGDSLLQ